METDAAKTTITFGMMLSLDGYIAGPDGELSLPPPEHELHEYWNELQRQATVSLYGRRMYEVMQYWESAEESPESTKVEREFSAAWKRTPKVVFSTTLDRVGPNARLAKGDLRQEVDALRREPGGNIQVSGAGIAASLARLGLIDEYHLYFFPIVLGGGTPFFEAGSSLKLAYVGSEKLPQDVLLVRYRTVR